MPAVATRSLLAELRAGTRDAHASAEAAARIDRRLATRAGYAALLGDLHALHAGFEADLDATPGLQDALPGIDLRGRRRAPLIARDLHALGHPVPTPAATGVAIDGPHAALGCLYVLEGSARGGAVIAARAAASLGADVPREGIAGGPPAVAAARWTALTDSLDRVGTGLDAAGRRRVLHAALGTFAAFRRRLAGPAT